MFTFINFDALVSSYNTVEFARHDFNGIFAVVSSYLYWKRIQECQIAGVTEQNAKFIELNKDAFCEKPEFVRNKIESYLLKTIRYCVALNSELGRRGHERFIAKVLKRDENRFWNLLDAQTIASEIADGYFRYTKKQIFETRWDFNPYVAI